MNRVREAILRSLHRSARLQALAFHFKESSARRILRNDLHHHPYKTQVVQALSEQDKVNRLQFCIEFLDLVNNNRDIVNASLMSDEAHFHLSGYVNKQNCRYWAPNNPRELHQRPLYSAKVTVWCAVSSGGIVGPYFFVNEEGRAVTVNSERYKVMLETFLQNELHPRQHVPLWFQQDGATAHTSRICMAVLREIFPRRLISRFGDINVYETRPANIDELKRRIQECIQGIPNKMLRRVMTSLPSRLKECIERNGGHLQSVIYKQ
jgi:hypothetical protein